MIRERGELLILVEITMISNSMIWDSTIIMTFSKTFSKTDLENLAMMRMMNFSSSFNNQVMVEEYLNQPKQ